jgi:hypothetical protein
LGFRVYICAHIGVVLYMNINVTTNATHMWYILTADIGGAIYPSLDILTGQFSVLLIVYWQEHVCPPGIMSGNSANDLITDNDVIQSQW